MQEQLKAATGKKEAVAAKLELARLRVKQLKELADTGAGNRFDYEQAQADVANLEGELASAAASESQIRETLSGKTPEGEQDTVANIKAQIAQAEAQLARRPLEPGPDSLPGTDQRHGGGPNPASGGDGGAAADGAGDELRRGRTVDSGHLQPERGAGGQARPGGGDLLQDVSRAGSSSAQVDSIMWATAQGQLPIGSMNMNAGVAPIPPYGLAVRLLPDRKDKDIFLAAGARGAGAVYTDSGEMIQILRRVLLRVSAKLDWLILKLH